MGAIHLVKKKINDSNIFILQAIFWLLVPKLIREEKIKQVLTMLLVTFSFQFLPKVYHSFCLARRMRKVTGYIFGTIWWGFGLNLVAYLIASHVGLI
jgi:cyclic nucleotide gated channel